MGEAVTTYCTTAGTADAVRLVPLGVLQRVAGRRARRLTSLHILHNSARSLRLVILNAIYTRLHIRSGGDGEVKKDRNIRAAPRA